MATNQVIKSFARSAPAYDAHAQVQCQCAQRLALYTQANTRDLTEGPVLEVGCGTGIFTAKLTEIFPERQITISDPCPEMLEQCKTRLLSSPRLHFQNSSINGLEQEAKYALVTAAFVLQWVEDFNLALTKLAAVLKPGGAVFFSMPTSGSFPEWKALCKQAGVSFTGNVLPSASDFKNFSVQQQMRLSVYEENFQVHHESLEKFLGGLKSIGAGTSLNAARMSVKETRRLLDEAHKQHPDTFTVTYKVLFGHLMKP